MKNLAHVFVVEDDLAIQELIRYTLEQAGFAVSVFVDAETALDDLRAALPDVILIDWMLPGMSGLALAKRLRTEARSRNLPLVMVTARGEEADRIAGLEQGADDYLVKPFSPRELVARINAVLRRRAPELADQVLILGPLKINPASHEVHLHDVRVDLAPSEYKLLKFFMANPGRVYNRAQLLDHVWGDHVFIEERTVDVHIRRLRLALGAEGEAMIETVRGMGYKFTVAH